MPVATTMNEILHPGSTRYDPEFPNAPEGWTQSSASAKAADEGLAMLVDHWEVIRILQGCFAEDQNPPLRRLHDALEARFSSKGGTRYLYQLLPGGPIVQGCKLAGLQPPTGSTNRSFGSIS